MHAKSLCCQSFLIPKSACCAFKGLRWRTEKQFLHLGIWNQIRVGLWEKSKETKPSNEKAALGAIKSLPSWQRYLILKLYLQFWFFLWHQHPHFICGLITATPFHDLCQVRDIVSSKASSWMHLDHLCHLGFLPVLLTERPLCGGTQQLLMPRGFCSELITYWHLSLLQPKENQCPCWRLCGALIITDKCQWYWKHCLVSHSHVFLSPEQFGIPHFLSLVVLDPVSHWNLMFLSRGGEPRLWGEAARATGNNPFPELPWAQHGSSSVPCRAVGGTHSTQGFSGATGVGLLSDQSQAALGDLSPSM